MAEHSFDDFMDIIRKLRSREGCPWDREQTHESLKTCLIEECYETVEAINNQDKENLCEELGDLLLQVALHSAIAEEAEEFTIQQVIEAEAQKMIRRHPHVFGDVKVADSAGVVKNWEEIKTQEKKSSGIPEEMLNIPKALPANIRADKVLKKASKAGLDFEDCGQVFKMMHKALEELEEYIHTDNKNNLEERFGAVMLQMVSLSRFLQLNAENSLTNATNKFINRFVDVFTQTAGEGPCLCGLSPADKEFLWRGVK